MAVPGLVVAPLVKAVIEKFLVPELTNLAHREGLDTAIQKLEKTFKDIQAALADAEDKQISNRAVKIWLEDLHHLAYDADDVLDEFATEALRRKIMAERPDDDQRSSITSKVRRFLVPTCSTVFTPSKFAFNSAIRSKIEEIHIQLQEIATRRTKLGLVEKDVGEMSANVQKRTRTTCLMKEPRVYGRDEETEQIIELLLRGSAPTAKKVDVIPIVGMGGIGKTTLAQRVYNDDRVKNHFKLNAWVCVSDDFDVRRITKAILESFTLETCSLGELNELQLKLNKELDGKKFLLVLDDVWYHKSDEWDSLRPPFGVGAHGSKIIVTTRDDEVAKRMATVKHHKLKNLSDDECWSIFAQYAFENRDLSELQELELIGRQIIAKCGGLPLAARALGGLLRYTQEEDEWKEILHNNILNLPYKGNDILPALKLSYIHLPSHLKRCFAYCAIIPKDYEFQEEELVLLWMAEGLISVSEGRKQIEDLGSLYFQELVSRSLFQTSSGNRSQFIMHDLVNDLAQVVAGDVCFILENNLEDGTQNKISKRARHSSYIASKYDGAKKFRAFDDARRLRTFLQFWPTSTYDSYLTRYLFHDLLPNLKCLRELRLCGYVINELPDSIGDLKHLRYLNVSKTYIRRLPDSVMRLYNLQVLLLEFCHELEKLPLCMGSLESLRHLNMTDAACISSGEMPLQISKLTNLQSLSNFMVGEDSGRRIGELGKLSHIRGAISISRLEKVRDAQEAREANLKSKQGLRELTLEWEVERNDEVEREVLEKLTPYKLLERITIRGYGSTTFPAWVGDASFSKMVLLRLEDCTCCTVLPPLGQLPSLQDLYIKGMKAIKHVGSEFFGEGCAKPFPLLKSLCFENIQEWNDWSASGVDIGVQPYTLLSVLSIQNCPKLVGSLPNNLPCLISLKIKKCPQLLVDISSLVHPSLTSLSIDDVPFPSLPANLEMWNALELGSICDASVALADPVCRHLNSVISLSIINFEKVTFLPKCFTQGLMGLEELKIGGGKELVTLWQNEESLRHCLPALRDLDIWKCPQLISLLEEEDEDEKGRGGKQQQQQQQHEEALPCMMRWLKHLRIEDCKMLKKLPQGLHTLTSLVMLIIEGCPTLVSFPKTGLPSMLRDLSVKHCSALQSLGELMMLNNLEWLKVSYCASLTYVSSSGGLPSTLKHLDISWCDNLVSLLAEEEGMKISFPSLETLGIWQCENLESLPEGPTTNLRELTISGCEKLEALPLGAQDDESNNNHHHQLASSLQELYLSDCSEGIVSYFLKEGTSFHLTSLTSLTIRITKEVSQT